MAVQADHPGVRVAHDGQQRVQGEGHERGRPSDPEERDHEDQERQRRHRLEHRDRAELELAQPPEPRGEDAERQPGRDGDGQRHDDQVQVIEGQGRELGPDPARLRGGGALGAEEPRGHLRDALPVEVRERVQPRHLPAVDPAHEALLEGPPAPGEALDERPPREEHR